MRGHIIGSPSVAGMVPHLAVAWHDSGGWVGVVLAGSRQVIETLGGRFATKDDALAAAEAHCKAGAKAGRYVSVGVVRADLVRVVAICVAHGREVQCAAWMLPSESLEETLGRFSDAEAPARVVSVDGRAA